MIQAQTDPYQAGYEAGRRKQANEDEWRLKMMRDELRRLQNGYLRKLVWRLFNVFLFDMKMSDTLRDEVVQVLPSPDEALRWMKEDESY